MATSATPQRTDFTLDALGRYICNGLDEATASTDPTQHAGARPFDIIILGAGSFGSVLASHLFANDTTHAHRILVLEAGPLVLPEHVQNLPPPLSPSEVWGVPWNSDSPRAWNQRFPGLAFCLGGRSLFWGGWSPYFIGSELPPAQWPAGVLRDLTTNVLPAQAPAMSYLDEAAEQIGSDTDNDFVFGPLHDALLGRLFTGLKTRAGGGKTELLGQRGTSMGSAAPATALKRELEAPLAVQSSSPRPGFFPFNKFNGAQLLIRAVRTAQAEAERAASGDAAAAAVKKRLMAVANAHVIGLVRDGRRITRVTTNQGTVDVPPQGVVVLGLGTIESTRLALDTLANADGLIGRNLMAHLRSNLTIRVPRSSFGNTLGALGELAVSALFVKGVHTHDDGALGHFHLQITASGVGALATDSEAELFKKLPDIDTLERFAQMNDQWIVITLRGIGEMVGDKRPAPENRITLDRLGPQGAFDYGRARALVRLEADDQGDPARHNIALWDAMDAAAEEVATMFGAGQPIEYLSTGGGFWQSTPPPRSDRRDTLSSTHHESGTLWMGGDPASSVTDEFGRFHESDNLYAVGPALLPTMGSPNPMLSGVALSRRTGDHLVARSPAPRTLESGFRWLFDGTEATFGRWLPVGRGAFALVDGAIVAQPGDGLALLFYEPEAFSDFTLRLQLRLDRGDDNSGVFVRMRDPRRPVPDRNPQVAPHPYDNQAWVGVDTGFEVQIDELARPDSADQHRTGAIYAIPVGTAPGQQDYQRGPALVAGQWTDYEIQVQGQTYTVRLGGQRTTTFTNPDTFRGAAQSTDPGSGYLGLQAHTGLVAFRDVRISVP